MKIFFFIKVFKTAGYNNWFKDLTNCPDEQMNGCFSHTGRGTKDTYATWWFLDKCLDKILDKLFGRPKGRLLLDLLVTKDIGSKNNVSLIVLFRAKLPVKVRRKNQSDQTFWFILEEHQDGLNQLQVCGTQKEKTHILFSKILYISTGRLDQVLQDWCVLHERRKLLVILHHGADRLECCHVKPRHGSHLFSWKKENK